MAKSTPRQPAGKPAKPKKLAESTTLTGAALRRYFDASMRTDHIRQSVAVRVAIWLARSRAVIAEVTDTARAIKRELDREGSPFAGMLDRTYLTDLVTDLLAADATAANIVLRDPGLELVVNNPVGEMRAWRIGPNGERMADLPPETTEGGAA